MAKRNSKAIKIIEEFRGLCVDWLKYQELNPDWKDGITSDDFGDEQENKKWIKKYDLVLAELRSK